MPEAPNGFLAAPPDHGRECEAYAAMLAGRPAATQRLDPDQLAQYDADLAKARAHMERAWLEHILTRQEPT